MATKTVVKVAPVAMERRNTSHDENLMRAGLISFKDSLKSVPKSVFATVKQAVEQLKAADVSAKDMLNVLLLTVDLPKMDVIKAAVKAHAYNIAGTPKKALVKILMGYDVEEVMTGTFYKTVKAGAGDKKAAKAAAATPAVKTPAPKVKAPAPKAAPAVKAPVAKKAPVVAKKAPAPAPKAAPVAKKVTKK